MEPRFAIRGLGEVALRVKDLDGMQKFYQETIRLELMRRFDNAAFFKIAEGYGGHTQILALFDRSGTSDYAGVITETSTLDHLAFEIALEDFETEKQRLEHLGLPVRTADHAWVRWRSIYVTDREGNEVELVCFEKV